MKYFVIFLVLSVFAGTMLATEFTQESYAITLGMSSEQIIENHQFIILGHIDSVETRSNQTEYTISVLDYIKSPDKFEEKETIKAVGCAEGQMGGCTTFGKGQNVLFPLNEKNGIFYISEVSFVAPNPDCTTNDLFALNDAKYGLETSQNNQTKRFFTGQPIDITFYAYNKKLDDSSYKVTVEFFRANNNTVFSKTFEGKFEECIPNVKLETAFTPADMGRYGKRYTASYGGGEMSYGFPIIEKGATPLKQQSSGIPSSHILCNDSLVLLQKYDGSPACVKEHSIILLMIRGWAEISEFEITSGFLKHEIKNGKITSLKLANDCAPFLIVTIDSQDSGELTISIPRKILDPKIGEFDDDFFVLVDGKEPDFEELNSNQFERTLKIPFEKDSKSIEIIQVCLI